MRTISAEMDRSDQQSFRKIIIVETKDDPCIVVIDTNCGLHGQHLIVNSSISICDFFLMSHNISWRYFGSLAKLTHIWRHHARRVFVLWKETYGSEEALAFAKTCPGKPIAGRWGSIFAIQDRVAKAGFAKVAAILQRVCRSAAAAGADLPCIADQDAATAADEFHIEETKAYRANMGRWRRDTERVLMDPLFDFVIHMMLRAHAPLQHHMAVCE